MVSRMVGKSGVARWVRPLAVIASFGLVAVPAHAQKADHSRSSDLTGAAEIGYAPFMFKTPDGTLQGFNFDMSADLAKRLGRPGLRVVDVPWPNIFAGLYAKRYEYIAAPVTITEKRAAEMLFSEPYLDVRNAFVTRPDDRIKSTGDLKGKKVAVVSGSIQDDWMAANAQRYGIRVLRFDSTPDALQALQIGRADSHMTGALAGLWLIKKQPGKFAMDLVMPVSGELALAFRPDDVDFRNRVESQLECMKLDGTLAALYQKWFGAAPAPGSSTIVAYEGFGAQGVRGYISQPHAVNCPAP